MDSGIAERKNIKFWRHQLDQEQPRKANTEARWRKWRRWHLGKEKPKTTVSKANMDKNRVKFRYCTDISHPEKEKHRTSRAQSTALLPLKHGTFSQRSPYFFAFHAWIFAPSSVSKGRKGPKTWAKRAGTATEHDTKNLKIYWQNEFWNPRKDVQK